MKQYVVDAFTERVHGNMEQGFPKVKHVMIHVNPWEPEKSIKRTE